MLVIFFSGVIKSYKINILLLWNPNGFQILEYVHRQWCST